MSITLTPPARAALLSLCDLAVVAAGPTHTGFAELREKGLADANYTAASEKLVFRLSSAGRITAIKLFSSNHALEIAHA